MRNFTHFHKDAFCFSPLKKNILSENQSAAIRRRFTVKLFFVVIAIWLSTSGLVVSQSSDCVPGEVQNGANDPWSEQCYLNQDCEEQGNPCQANDVTLTGVFVADAEGGPISICDTDEQMPFYLWGNFVNNTNSNRYSVRTVSELYINGVYQLEINQCSFDFLPPGESQSILLSDLAFTCGDELEMVNTWVGWDTSPSQCSDPGEDNYDCCCNDYPSSKCSQSIDAISFLIPNFSYVCNGSGDGVVQLCITNLSYGGFGDVTYTFDFGDGFTTPLLNSCHTYNVDSGTFILVLTAIDELGITASASDTIHLEDLDCCQLEYTCPPHNGGLFICADDVPLPDEDLVEITDYCGTLTIDVSDATSGGGCPDDSLFITRTYYLGDDFSNETCVQVFTVADTILPSITCPANITIACASEIPLPDLDLVTSDNCDGPVTVEWESDVTISFTCENQYTITRVYTAVDHCGNSSNCSQSITVLDTIAPVITCLADITVECASEVPDADLASIEATDNCNVLITITVAEDDTTNFTCGSQYTILRVYTAVDYCGNSTTCAQSITVSDTTAPDITCLEDISVECATDIPEADINSITATDNCNVLVTITVASDDTTDFICTGNYTILRVYTAVDSCGNSSSCSQSITVSDTTAPFITCLDNIAVECAFDIPAADIGSIEAADNCDAIVTITVAADDTTSFTCGNQYTILRVYTAVDSCGNSSTCAQTITVSDTTAPVITCLENFTVGCAADVPGADIDSIDFTDNCNVFVTITVAQDDTTGFVCDNQYTISRVYTAVDSCGNSTTCSQVIVVNDTVPPVITCPDSLTVLCGDVPEPDPGSVIASDNCDSVELVVFVEDITIGVPCAYEIQRVYRAEDACGNTASCIQIITVVDTELLPEPIDIEVPDTLIVQCYGQDSTWTVPELDIHDITISGGCSVPVITNTDTITVASENCAEDGYIAIYERIYTAVDSCGNTDSDTLILIIVDTIPPVIHNIPADITVDADSIPLPPTDIFATDGCLCACVMLLQETPQGDGCLNNTVITRTWSSRDECGNQTIAVQRITVLDNDGPRIALDLPGMHIQNGDTIFFNCETGGIPDEIQQLNIHSISFDDPSLPIRADFNMDSTINRNCEFYGFLEERIYTWTVIDECDNVGEFSFTVWLNDHQAPVISAVPDTACIDDVLLDLVEAEDNCSQVSLRFWDVPFDNPCGEGTAVRRTYEASDACGNLALDTAILVPDDNLAPLLFFSHPALVGMQQGDTIEVECNSAKGTYTDFGPLDISHTDMCPTGYEITLSEEWLSNGNCLNDHTVATIRLTWMAIDHCGNAGSMSLIAIVKDHTPPVPVNFSQEISVGCTAQLKDIVVSDNCGSVTISNQDIIQPGPCLYKYDIRRQITVTDQCGNAATFSQLIHVGDDNGPVVKGVEEGVCDDLSMPLVTAFDSCAGVNVGITMVEDTLDDTCLEGLVIRRVWTAVDLCGDTTSLSQLIILGDTIPPQIIVPDNSIIEQLLSSDSLPVIYLSQVNMMNDLNLLDALSVLVLDNCDLEIQPLFQVTVTSSQNPQGDGFMEHRYYSWMATDICGNRDVVEFTVRIVDDMPPVVGLPGDTVIYCSPLPPPVSMIPEDTSEFMSVTFSEIISNGSHPGEFNVIRTWTFTDMSGNVSVMIQHIRWIPDSFIDCDILPPPEVACNSHNVLIGSNVTGGFAPYTYYWVVVGDKCFIQEGQSTPEISIYVGWAPVTVILYVTDAFGCTTSCETIITCQVMDPGFAAPSQEPGITPLESYDAVSIWPNPTNGALDVRIDFKEKQFCQITLVNFLGETVWKYDLETTQGINELKFDLSNLPEGAYFMDFQSKDFHSLKKIMLLNNR